MCLHTTSRYDRPVSLEFGAWLDKWSGDGTKIYTFWKLLKKKAFNNSLPFTMTYKNLHKAMTGFVNNIKLDWKHAFSCPKCGTSPEVIVGVGKYTGPHKSKVKKNIRNKTR